ncbi:MAG TPA: ABC transporter permease [Anaerolineales bacterium]|nr:ABC transporter permease [Anaerolineales bacterium]
MWEFWIRSLNASTIFAIAGLGEVVGQRAGVMNVGVEGAMLFGATIGFIVAKTTGSYLLGFLAGIAIGALIGLLHAFFTITLHGDQVVNGMGIWILGFGLTTYIGSPCAGPLGMGRIPTIGGLSPFFFVALVLTFVIWFVLFKTHWGLKIRSVGENPTVAEVSGINVVRTRYWSVIFSGAMMGLAGAVYALDYNPVWSYNLLMGWGFIALALVFFSMWNPYILLSGAVLFGALWQVSLNPESFLPNIFSRYIWRTFPFVITIIILVIMSTHWFSSRWGAAKPEALGLPYEKD